MRDGTVLRADAWTPAGEGRWPVLLQRLPYGRSVASAPVLPHPEQLARRGYTVVVQDVRGRGDSDGAFAPFVDDGADGADSIEWAAALDFADGQVATYGFSYQGLNQLAAAAERPPSLRAIAPMMCAPDPYDHWTYEGGCLRWPFVAAWASQLAGQEPGVAPPAVDLDSLPLAEALGPEPPSWFVEWITHHDRDDYWTRRTADLDAIDVPVFTVLGYFDDFAPGTQALFERVGAEGVCGPWAHMPWGTRLGDVELGTAATPAVAHEALLAFFDRTLKDGPAPPSPVVYFDNVAGWRPAPTWPPPHDIVEWHATSAGNANSRHGDGGLGPAAPDAALCDVVVGEPLVPYPGLLGPLSDESPAEGRRDVLCYTTAPLASPLSLVGSADVRATAVADVDTHDLVVSLTVVDDAGTSRRLATGATRVSVSQGAPHDVDVTLSPVGWTLEAGQRLRLDLSLSRFPAYDRNTHRTDRSPACTSRADYLVGTLHLLTVSIELPVASSTAHDAP